jgi:hypothetical protein
MKPLPVLDSVPSIQPMDRPATPAASAHVLSRRRTKHFKSLAIVVFLALSTAALLVALAVIVQKS